MPVVNKKSSEGVVKELARKALLEYLAKKDDEYIKKLFNGVVPETIKEIRNARITKANKD